MKVKELLKEIRNCQKEYGKDFLDWEVYTEQMCESQKKKERKLGYSFEDADLFEYFKCFGFWTKCPNDRIFTINNNY